MTKNARIGAALVGGYLLGRTRKARLALGFGLFLAGRRLDLDPRRVGRALASSPLVGDLNDQVRKELVEATKSAAAEALAQRAAGLADSLSRRTRALGGSGDDLGDERDEQDEEASEGEQDEEASEDEPDEQEERAARDDGGKGKPRRATRSKAPAKKATGRAKSADGTGKSAATARKRTAAKKTATPSGRRTRGGGDRG
ncbi:hypothetical protein GCM10010275_51240 [Streptomyces litmocidini]|uniref:hypothetical protein n=1 Tax=Streptomyces litmocidini TaxID=67318 RepID=UPI00167C92CC|nr:hypothetical protein [Streptomyces litmocidini]GGV05423.1 hypothetical protein GCM10010275_51240 [Streptomyces litmocidini]